MLKKILKLFLLIILLTGLGVFIAWIVLIKGYPWWVGLSLALGLLGLWIGYIYIKKYLLRRREGKFVRRVIEQDEEAIKLAPPKERQNLKALQEKWKESIDIVRNSYLRKKGNPLYVLPWYLILGESGSGKTSAIKNTNLNSPITEVKRTAGISVTRNCDWWFFEEAIILDTAGRYTIPVDDSVDKEEWEKFLTLLSKYRRREPINGVIVTIASDKLLDMDEARLSDEGQSVRRRIDQLMRILGAKFPVYILVTKMDLVHGMVEFTNLLPDNAVDQAMGYINKEFNPDSGMVLKESMSCISRNLRDLTLLLVHQGNIPEPEIFLFPSGFERLEEGLKFFIKGVFEENPYQETPDFRGMFFSSAIQEGKACARSSQIFGLAAEKEGFAHNNGLFLKDMFKKILPRDRQLFAPLPEFLTWRRITRNLGLLSWISLWLCLCGFLSFSFINNMNSIKIVTGSSYKPPVIKGRISEDLLMLNRMRTKILGMEKANRRWILPWVGFSQSKRLELNLKNHFLRLFRDGLLEPFDTDMMQSIENSNRYTHDDLLLKRFEYIVARITLLRDYLRSKEIESMNDYNTISNNILVEKNPELTLEVAALYGTIFQDYLLWNKNRKEFETQLAAYQASLDKILERKEVLRRIVTGSITEVPDIHLDDFWGDHGSRESDMEEVFISGFFTYESQKQMEQFFDRIEKALVDETTIETEKKHFWNWYQTQMYDNWSSFSRRFPEETERMDNPSNWRHTATTMTTSHNPYFLLIEKMAEEFSRVPKINEEPNWVKLIRELDRVKKLAEIEKKKKNGSILGRIESTTESIVQTTMGKFDEKKAQEAELRTRLAVIWEEYATSLEQIAPAVTSKEMCFQMISEYKLSPFALAESKHLQLTNLLQNLGELPFVWGIVLGPQRFLTAFCVKETACVLQERWEEEVVGGAAGADSENIGQILFAKTDGLVWKFINTTGQPFISRGSSGYQTRKEFQGLIPFNSGFFSFLDSGAENVLNYQPTYYVTIETLPLDVNNEAKVSPYGCILSLQCAEEKLVLDNYNYPQKQTFNWSSDNCGNVSLSILLPEITLNKNYEGKLGFANFLTEFRDGSRTFNAEEFPGEVDELKKMGISWIRLSYKITGGQPVIRLLEKFPSSVPGEIVACWSR